MSPSNHVVHLATDADLSSILDWLKREYEADEYGEGFWCNRRLISKAQGEGELWVVRDDANYPIGFIFGFPFGGIVCVKKPAQGQGVGTALVQARSAAAIQDGVCVLRVECSPRSSIPFWTKMGFEPYEHRYSSNPHMRRLIPRQSFPERRDHAVSVVVEFYPEAVKYKDGVTPLRVFAQDGDVQDNLDIVLAERIIFPMEDEGDRDVVVRVIVNGTELWMNKAKYPEAWAAGVRAYHRSGAYVIDEIPAGAADIGLLFDVDARQQNPTPKTSDVMEFAETVN